MRSSLDILFRRSLGPIASGRTYSTISVFKGNRFATSKGGRTDCGYGDRVVLWVSRVRHCALTILNMRHFRLGADSVATQVTGIPTGGPISGACLNASFAAEEELFDKFGWSRLSQRLGLRGRRKQYIVLR